MYLVLGKANDPCCSAVSLGLKARGHRVEIVESIFSSPQRFAWRYAGANRHSRIGVPGLWSADSGDIEGLFVRETDAPALNGWSEQDAQYMATEMKAALLGWLWSLDCAVVNRVPAWLWYQPRTSLLSWVPMLRRAGLRTPAMTISNDGDGIGEWRSRHAKAGAVYAPLTSPQCYPLQTAAEWDGAMRVARHSPLLVREAHGETRLACVVGERVIWDLGIPRGGEVVADRLVRFARSARLNFVQVAIAELPGCDGGLEELAVVAVDTQVQFQRFSWKAREAIAEAVVDLMTLRVCDGEAGYFEAADAVLVEGGSR